MGGGIGGGASLSSLFGASLPELIVSTMGTAHPPSWLLWVLLCVTTLQATLNTAVTASVLAPRSAYLSETPSYFVLVTGARLDAHYGPDTQLILFIVAAAWCLAMVVFFAALLRHRGAA